MDCKLSTSSLYFSDPDNDDVVLGVDGDDNDDGGGVDCGRVSQNIFFLP